jgi:hypothetical protein
MRLSGTDTATRTRRFARRGERVRRRRATKKTARTEKNERRRLDDHLGPTREALLLGWRVAAVRSEESSDRNLGGLKTQRSLDAKNARIRAGEIRLAHA